MPQSAQQRASLPLAPASSRCSCWKLARVNNKAKNAFSSVLSVSVGLRDLSCKAAKPIRGQNRRRTRLHVEALVAVDYSQPAIWLGLGLIGGGLGLYQLRRVQPVLSRDFDIVVSSVLIFSGGILIFQGWRLDPLLLFCQLLTAGTALSWALEAINLRKLVDNERRFDERSRQFPPMDDNYPRGDMYGRGLPLPPPREQDFGAWYQDGDPRIEEMPPAASRGYYDGQGQDSYYPPTSGGGYYRDLDGYYDQPGNVDSPPGPREYYGQGQEGQFYEPLRGDTAAGSSSTTGSGVVDEVENFYKRPGSVVEDVERFYDGKAGGDPRFPSDGQIADSRDDQGWSDDNYTQKYRDYPDASEGNLQETSRDGTTSDFSARDQRDNGRRDRESKNPYDARKDRSYDG